jgi:hypothetical protein
VNVHSTAYQDGVLWGSNNLGDMIFEDSPLIPPSPCNAGPVAATTDEIHGVAGWQSTTTLYWSGGSTYAPSVSDFTSDTPGDWIAGCEAGSKAS